MNPEREREKIQLQERKGELAQEKREYEAKLTELRNTVRSSGKMHPAKYKKLCDDQNGLVKCIRDTESQLFPIASKLRSIYSEEQIEYHSAKEILGNKDQSPIVRELVALRQEYQDYAADATRVSSTRIMAANFVNKLNPIIKRAVGSE